MGHNMSLLLTPSAFPWSVRWSVRMITYDSSAMTSFQTSYPSLQWHHDVRSWWHHRDSLGETSPSSHDGVCRGEKTPWISWVFVPRWVTIDVGKFYGQFDEMCPTWKIPSFFSGEFSVKVFPGSKWHTPSRPHRPEPKDDGKPWPPVRREEQFKKKPGEQLGRHAALWEDLTTDVYLNIW